MPANGGRDRDRRRTVADGTVRLMIVALLGGLLVACDGTGPVTTGKASGGPSSGTAAAAPPPASLPGTAGTASPSAPAVSPAPATPVPAGGPGTTRGTGTRASQSTGQGFVDTAVENRLPGARGWQTSQSERSGRRRRIEGFGHAISVTAGTPVRLFVSASASTFRIQMLRLGWYQGLGAREVWTSVPVAGGLQAPARKDPVTRMLSAPWKVSATVPTDGLVAGDYVLKLLGADGASSFVPFIVRETRSTDALLMLNSALTWVAYNPWGGANSYSATGGGEGSTKGFEGRSVVSSFDRPFARGSGTGGLFDEEFNLVSAAERGGLRLNYAAEGDLHSTPQILDGARGAALLGHSEYWSRPMRAALTAARDRGVNLGFFGANHIFRRIRLAPSAQGPDRLMINYKVAAEDPDKTADSTADWPKDPFPDPEISLLGTQYRCAKTRADLVITEPDSWLFSGLHLTRGQKLPGMIGPEYDRVVPALKPPRPIQIMAHSPVPCYGQPDFSDLTWYSHPSGAGVFSAGTLDWNMGLTSRDKLTRTVVTTATERVLAAIARPKAAQTVPAIDTMARYYHNPSGIPLDLDGKPVLPSKRP